MCFHILLVFFCGWETSKFSRADRNKRRGAVLPDKEFADVEIAGRIAQDDEVYGVSCVLDVAIDSLRRESRSCTRLFHRGTNNDSGKTVIGQRKWEGSRDQNTRRRRWQRRRWLEILHLDDCITHTHSHYTITSNATATGIERIPPTHLTLRSKRPFERKIFC